MKKSRTIDEYIESAPKSIQPILKTIREKILEVAPEAVESISYGMPAFKVKGKPLAYFAFFEHHIGFYPTPTGVTAFKEDLAKFKQGKGSVQFPLAHPVPYGLIKKIVKYRKNEILSK